MKNKLVLRKPNENLVTVTERDGIIHIRVDGALKLTLNLSNTNKLTVNTRLGPNLHNPVYILGGFGYSVDINE